MAVEEFINKADEFNEAYRDLMERSNEFYRKNGGEITEIRDQARETVELAKDTKKILEEADLGEAGETALNSFEEQVVEYIRRAHEIEREFADLVLRAKQAERLESLDSGELSTNLADKADDLSQILDMFDGLEDTLSDFAMGDL